MPFACFRRVLPALGLVLGFGFGLGGTGFSAFPKVPEGLKSGSSRLSRPFYIRARSVPPRMGPLFVAEDPMDQVGPYEANHGADPHLP